jgi:transposase
MITMPRPTREVVLQPTREVVRRQMAAFLRRHHYRGGKTPVELVARLRAAPVAPAGLPTATLAVMVTTQVELLRTLQRLISDTERLIAARVVTYPRTRVLADLPGVGMINLAQLLAEVGPILDRVDSAEQAATECGAAPVTRGLGQDQRGLLPLGSEHARAESDHQLRPQCPAAGLLGRQTLR